MHPLAAFRRFLADCQGHFAVMTAVSLLPLVGVIGLAIDVTHALEVRGKVAAASDAAAIAALNAGATMLASGGASAALASAQRELDAVFAAETVAESRYSPSMAGTVVMNKGTQLQAQLSYSASVPTTFLGLFGHTHLVVSGKATAEIEPATYKDILVLVDNSPSMGVGATMDDIRLMQRNTPDNCGFACHAMDNPRPYSQIAREIGARTRLDVVRSALTEMIASAREASHMPDQYRLGLYSFGAKAEALKLTTLSAPSGDSLALTKAAGTIDLMTTPTLWYKYGALSPIDSMLTQLAPLVGTSGNGLSGLTREKVVMLVSDGVTDALKPTGCKYALFSARRCQEPLNTAICTTLKARGVKIAVLYTTYLPLDNDDWYFDWIRPFAKEIAPQMRDCASPGLFFEVGFNQGIDDAMDALFRQIIAAPRIVS